MSVLLLITYLAFRSAKMAQACEPSLPHLLAEDLGILFPSSKIMTLAMLNPRERQWFQKEHPGKCPGLISLDFFGDGRGIYALVLSQPRPKLADQANTFLGSHEAILLLARPDETGKWAVQLLERGNNPTAMILSMPPDDYESVYGDSVIHAKHQVIGFGDFESVLIVFSWNGVSIEKIWLRD